MTPSSLRPALVLAVVALLFAIPACHHVPMATSARDTRPLPAELAARLRPVEPGTDLELEVAGRQGSFTRYLFRYSAPAWEGEGIGGEDQNDSEREDEGEDEDEEENLDETDVGTGRLVTGELYLVHSASAATPSPLVAIAPILGGAGDDYLASRVFAGWAADDGMSSFFLHQEATILDPSRGGAALERLLRQTTAENIRALHLLADRPDIDGERLGSFGISMGAIRNVLLAAAEPRLRGNILCLAGGDLPRILRTSREGMVLDYLRGRAEATGLTREQIIADIEAHLASDPIDIARHVDPRRVILFLGALDDKVPYPTGLALHRALGEPELWVLPVGHYTAIPCAPWTAGVAFEWLAERFQETSGERTAMSRGPAP